LVDFCSVFGSGLFSGLGAWVVSSAAVGPRSDVGGGSLFTSDPTKKAVSADRNNTNTILIIHSRARPHLEVLQATDHNLSRLFSPSTNVKVDVYVLTAPNARAKIHPRPQDATISIGRSADELLRAAHECGGEPRVPKDGLHKASGADAKLRGSGRGNSTLDTLRAITTRPAARSHHTPRSAAREVLGYQRGTPARLRTSSLLRYFPHSGYLGCFIRTTGKYFGSPVFGRFVAQPSASGNKPYAVVLPGVYGRHELVL
jgi:hypothetical protein